MVAGFVLCLVFLTFRMQKRLSITSHLSDGEMMAPRKRSGEFKERLICIRYFRLQTVSSIRGVKTFDISRIPKAQLSISTFQLLRVGDRRRGPFFEKHSAFDVVLEVSKRIAEVNTNREVSFQAYPSLATSYVKTKV